MKRIAVCVLVVGALAFGVSAALTPGQKLAAETLIKQFSAADFDARQKAVDQLVGMGLDVVPVVKKALVETVDNEVKMRCEMVLKGLREKFGAAAVDGSKVEAPVAPGPIRPVAGDFPPSKITIDLKDADLAEILAEFARQSGNAPVHVPQKWDGEPVTFEVKDMPYWQALDKLCATLGRVY